MAAIVAAARASARPFGVDGAPTAVEIARRHAAERGVMARFDDGHGFGPAVSDVHAVALGLPIGTRGDEPAHLPRVRRD
ncbi:hypothetical protein [Mycobacterium kyogaense]|uniref:hypothetical protein n=1 Tax=Mycobacterium kyogaense TaxID=2212479 RepID=UPI002FF577A3